MSTEPVAGPVSAQAVVRHVLACEAGALVRHDPDVRAQLSGESVHQMRVATRRLRSELRVLAPALSPAAVRRLDPELAWLGRALGRVRDVDVMVELIEGLGTRRELEGAAAFLRRRRAKESAKLREAVESARYRRLLRGLVRAVAKPPLVGSASLPARAVFLPGLRGVVVSFGEAIVTAQTEPGPAHLHAVRIAAKTVRYNVEVGEYYVRGDLESVVRAFVALQDVLGSAGDLAMAAESLPDLPAGVVRELTVRRDEVLTDWGLRADRARSAAVGLLARLEPGAD